MRTYLLRLTDDEHELRVKARARAVREGLTFRDLLIALLRYYVRHGLPR